MKSEQELPVNEYIHFFGSLQRGVTELLPYADIANCRVYMGLYIRGTSSLVTGHII